MNKSDWKKEAKKVFLDAVIDQIVVEGVNFQTATRLNTAFWYYDKKHHITIGEGILSSLKDEKEPKEQIKSYLYHELGHAYFTERDMKAIKDALKAKNISFDLFNLFEDARIEELVRQKTSYQFDWIGLEEMSQKEEKSPRDIFFECIQKEGKFLPLNETEERIFEYYYQMTLLCPTSFHVLDLIEEFIEEFPNANQSQKSDQDGEDDNESGNAEQRFADEFINGENPEEALRDCEITIIVEDGVLVDEESEMLESNSKNTKKSKKSEESKRVSKVDYDFSNKSYRKLMPFFEDKTILAPTRRVSKRINTKGVIQDKDSVYKRKLIIGRAKKKFNIIIDCSGSMYGEPISHAATLTHMFSILAKEGLIQGKLILSSSARNEIYDIRHIDDNILENRVKADSSGEGFQYTFNKYQKELSKADINFVITDGCLTDGPLNKRAMKSQGIYTWGLYVGDSSDYGTLDQWFDRSNCVLDIGELIDKMAINIKSL